METAVIRNLHGAVWESELIRGHQDIVRTWMVSAVLAGSSLQLFAACIDAVTSWINLVHWLSVIIACSTMDVHSTLTAG